MQKQIETIRDSSSRVYRDEPIIRTAAQAANLTPPQYREMRKIANSLFYESEARVFYEQGKFMEDFEDDYTFQGEFHRYFPTYQVMTDIQLRGYFSWRTGVRRGTIVKTSLSFVFVYIYELLNQIGVQSAEEGFYALKNFWEAYEEVDAKINNYVRLWLNDYVVYNNLNKSLLDDLSYGDFNDAALVLLNYKSHSPGDVFEALNFLSSYDMKNSRFYKQYPDDVKDVLYCVFFRLSGYYDKKNKKSLCEKFFGKIYPNPYSMFKSAVFCHPKKHEDVVYEINDICKYTCQNGIWSCERFYCYKGKIQKIGALLKTVDFLMRREYGFKSTMKTTEITKILQDIIVTEIEKYREDKRKATLPKIEIDVTKLQDIRDSSFETQNKLIIEDPEDIDTLDPFDTMDETADRKDTTGLSDHEYRFMQRLLYGRAYDDFLRTERLMLSVLVDAINESLFDRFDDTVIIFEGEKPALIEDYIDELKSIIRE